MRFKRRSPCLAIAALVLLMLPVAALAQVSVFAEAAYTAADLVVYIYGNLEGSPFCSFGVSLNYNAGNLTPNMDPTKTKINKDIWYFGSTPPGTGCPNCVTDTGAQIVFIGGKLDTDPGATQGVIGTRTLLATATFSRDNTNTDFGISLALGKTHPPFDNFVALTTPATVLDGSVSFNSVTVRERGDANGDGTIDIADTRLVRQIFLGSSPWVVFADCDGDGVIDITDTRCIRNKFLNP